MVQKYSFSPEIGNFKAVLSNHGSFESLDLTFVGRCLPATPNEASNWLILNKNLVLISKII